LTAGGLLNRLFHKCASNKIVWTSEPDESREGGRHPPQEAGGRVRSAGSLVDEDERRCGEPRVSSDLFKLVVTAAWCQNEHDKVGLIKQSIFKSIRREVECIRIRPVQLVFGKEGEMAESSQLIPDLKALLIQVSPAGTWT
jgi:hypothetical protein